MQTLATGPRSRRSTGFSLVELMVVLVIMGLVGTAVLLTAPAPEARLVAQAEQLAAHLARAREEAIISNRSVALRVHDQGYGFSVRRAGKWEPLGPAAFADRRFEGDVRAVLDPDAPFERFEFDSTGATEGGAVTLAGAGSAWRVDLDAEGRLSVQPASR